jgi:hypothetical protein
MDCLIFSKDRACQLELLLRSINDNFNGLNCQILTLGSNDKFQHGYNIVRSKYPQHKWFKQNSLAEDIKNIIRTFSSKYCLCLVDDEVVISDYDIKEGFELLDIRNDLHTVSLRLHPSCNYCYTANMYDKIPKYEKVGNLNLWRWADQNPAHDLGYPSCINSHIYRTEEFKDYVCEKLKFYNVNNLEGIFNLQRKHFRPYMACFDKPKTINIANNLTQSGNNRYGKNSMFTLENLNNKFLEGYKISTKNIYGIDINMPTFEHDYILEKL